MRRPSLEIAALALVTLVLVAPACAARVDRLVPDDPPEPDDAREAKSKPNLPIRTLGGRQLWADVDWFAGWRIQEHVWTGHHRLLDPVGIRRAWGSREACSAELAAERERRNLVLAGDHLVVLLHGLGRSSNALRDMETAISETGLVAASIGYPSTRRSIAGHADRIEAWLDGLEDIERVSFVTHSLGGLVARDLLGRDSEWKQRMEVGRLVMLGPPNRGSALARSVEGSLPFRVLVGQTGHDTARAEVPLPTCEFGIVAGGRGDERGWNPAVPGDDDGVVGVEETRLDGAADFLVVRKRHSYLKDDPDVMAATLRFLESGSFDDTASR